MGDVSPFDELARRVCEIMENVLNDTKKGIDEYTREELVKIAEAMIFPYDRNCRSDNDPVVREWCSQFETCMQCQHVMVERLVKGNVRYLVCPEVYVVFRRMENGDLDERRPSFIERIFYDHDKAVEWVASHKMSVEPTLSGSTENRELYVYHCDGLSVADGFFPQYIIEKYKVG